MHSLSGFPNVAEHLEKFKSILADRREVEDRRIEYFQLQWPRTESIFTGAKIVVPYRSGSNSFAHDSSEWFCRSDGYVITQKSAVYDLKYLLALLNSRLYFQWLYHRGKRKGEMLELFQVPLSEIPIKRIPKDDQECYINLAEQDPRHEETRS
jgi:adenine-specific DNA-methyltransferase